MEKKIKYVLKLENAKDCLILNLRKVLFEVRWKKQINYVFIFKIGYLKNSITIMQNSVMASKN